MQKFCSAAHSVSLGEKLLLKFFEAKLSLKTQKCIFQVVFQMCLILDGLNMSPEEMAGVGWDGRRGFNPGFSLT